jgi:hypothetical protein
MVSLKKIENKKGRGFVGCGWRVSDARRGSCSDFSRPKSGKINYPFRNPLGFTLASIRARMNYLFPG